MRPTGRVYPNQKQISGVELKEYDTASNYDKPIVYSGAYDFVAFAPLGKISQTSLQGRINIYE